MPPYAEVMVVMLPILQNQEPKIHLEIVIKLDVAKQRWNVSKSYSNVWKLLTTQKMIHKNINITLKNLIYGAKMPNDNINAILYNMHLFYFFIV